MSVRKGVLGFVLPIAVVLAGFSALLAPATAAAAPVVVIHLKNASSYCADIKDGHDTGGNAVWLYSCSGASDDHFYEVPSPGNVIASPCQGDPDCYEFQDVRNTSLCLGLSNTGYADIRACDNQYADWIEIGTVLRNDGWAYDLFAQTDSNESAMAGNPNGVDWYQWSGF
jgi:hypothetical protein